MSEETRKDTRMKAQTLRARYKSATVEEFIEHYARDISRSGIFIKTPKPPPTGVLLKIEIQLRDGTPVLGAVGRVIWKREEAEATSSEPAGMGIKFLKIDEASQPVIERIVALKGEGAGPHFDNVRPSVTPEAAAPESKPEFFTPENTPEFPPEQDRTVMRQMNALLGEALRLTSESAPLPESAATSKPSQNATAMKSTIVGFAMPPTSRERASVEPEKPSAGTKSDTEKPVLLPDASQPDASRADEITTAVAMRDEIDDALAALEALSPRPAASSSSAAPPPPPSDEKSERKDDESVVAGRSATMPYGRDFILRPEKPAAPEPPPAEEKPAPATKKSEEPAPTSPVSSMASLFEEIPEPSPPKSGATIPKPPEKKPDLADLFDVGMEKEKEEGAKPLFEEERPKRPFVEEPPAPAAREQRVSRSSLEEPPPATSAVYPQDEDEMPVAQKRKGRTVWPFAVAAVVLFGGVGWWFLHQTENIETNTAVPAAPRHRRPAPAAPAAAHPSPAAPAVAPAPAPAPAVAAAHPAPAEAPSADAATAAPATGVIRVNLNVPRAQIYVNDEPRDLPANHNLDLPIGHEVTIRAHTDGYDDASALVTPTSLRQTVVLTLRRPTPPPVAPVAAHVHTPPPPAAPPAAPPPAPPAHEPSHHVRTPVAAPPAPPPAPPAAPPPAPRAPRTPRPPHNATPTHDGLPPNPF